MYLHDMTLIYTLLSHNVADIWNMSEEGLLRDLAALVRSVFFVPLSSQIRIRDPNQGGRDITEEIMAGSSGSRNSTPPVGRPSSTPTPPQVWLSWCPHPPAHLR